MPSLLARLVPRPLAANGDYVALWASTGISHFGTMFGALSLTALLYLGATATQMGVLAAATTAPALLVALFAGVWVDRLPRRLLLIGADLGRCALLATIPVAALLDQLTMAQLYAVAFVDGCLEVTFSLAYRSILPSIVHPSRLVQANAGLRMTEAAAESVSPAIGGGIVQAAGAPVAVLADAATFMASAIFLTRLRVERVVSSSASGVPAWREAMAGFGMVARDPSLRAILGMSCSYGFFGAFLITLFSLRIIRDLGFSPLALGVIAGAGGVGAVLGSAMTTRIVGRLGIGPAILVSYLLATGFDLTIPLAGGPAWLAFTVLFAGQLLSTAFYVVENVSSLSLRQALTPPDYQGRVNAAYLTANRALRPAGSVVAGLAAAAFGVQAALLVGAAGIIAASLWLVFSPVPRIQTAQDGLS